jgi:hypothetical protein
VNIKIISLGRKPATPRSELARLRSIAGNSDFLPGSLGSQHEFFQRSQASPSLPPIPGRCMSCIVLIAARARIITNHPSEFISRSSAANNPHPTVTTILPFRTNTLPHRLFCPMPHFSQEAVMHTQIKSDSRSLRTAAPPPCKEDRRKISFLPFEPKTPRPPRISELLGCSGVNTVMLISALQSGENSVWLQPCNVSANYFRTLSSL